MNENIVYNDIKESKYLFTYDNLKFYFSSNFYLEKFKNQYTQFLKDEIIKLQLRFKCNIHCDELILLLLYKRIEKRGFRVLYNDKELKENYYITCNINEW